MSIFRSLLRVLYPIACPGCGEMLLTNEVDLCVQCQMSLPLTHFSNTPFNLTEQRITGRFPYASATSYMYYQGCTISRPIVHAIKYHDNIRLARTLGRRMGLDLIQSGRFDDVELIIPIPLHPRKQHQRDYNQSEELCRGISEITHLPVITNNLYRNRYTNTQTHLSASERFINMHEVFSIRHPKQLHNRHILIVDDVITTGATIEAACKPLLTIPGITISIATLAIASK